MDDTPMNICSFKWGVDAKPGTLKREKSIADESSDTNVRRFCAQQS